MLIETIETWRQTTETVTCKTGLSVENKFLLKIISQLFQEFSSNATNSPSTHRKSNSYSAVLVKVKLNEMKKKTQFLFDVLLDVKTKI